MAVEDGERQQSNELAFLGSSWVNQAREQIELARRAKDAGDDVSAQNFLTLAALYANLAGQSLNEAGQIVNGEKPDGEIPRFTVLPWETP